MTNITRPKIESTPGFACSDAGTYFTQMEDQTKRLLDAIADITPEELEWQPAPRMNTIGMLLAHLAGTEVGWAMRGFQGYQASNLDEFIKRIEDLGFPDDGNGFQHGDGPPEYQKGRDLAFFVERMNRARAYWREAASKITCEQMNTEIRELVWDGTYRIYTPRWVMHHIHLHGPHHGGQIMLLRHMYRDQVS